MKYYITYIIHGAYVTEVEAENQKEAEDKADKNWQEADFGDANNIDGKIYCIETENGKEEYYF